MRRPRKRNLLFIAALAAVAVVATYGLVLAHSKTYTTNVKIQNYAGNTFSGKVGSPKPACRSGRDVTLKRVERGPNPTVGFDTTNAAGEWDITEPNADGKYRASVNGKGLGGGYRHNHRCGRGSDSIRV